MDELLKVVDKLYPNRLYGLTRDDGVLVSVTPHLKNIPLMISEEYCGVEVKLTKVIFNKHPCNYTIFADLTEETGDVNEYEFTLSDVVIYN